MSYIDGFIIPVKPGQKEAYRHMATEAADFFREYGALEIVECFEDDIPDGKVTDFRRAVAAQGGEKIVFSWIVWPSKEVRDRANQKMKDDPRMQPKSEVPFDMQRMIFGGFVPIFQMGGSETSTAPVREPEPA